MTEKDWDAFFELIEKITKLEGAWKDKATLVSNEAHARDASDNLDEFVYWFN